MSHTISVVRDFSRSPAGRTRDDGPYSGQAFREDVLLPALAKSADKIEIDLRGALGFGSSFLEEAFGGLVRIHHFAPDDLRRRLFIQSDLDTYVSKIWSYVTEAGRHH